MALTPDLVGAGAADVHVGGLADVVAGGAVPVLEPWWASRAGPAGFGCTGRLVDLPAQVAKPSPDPGGGQPLDRQRLLPGTTQVGGEMTGQAQLGVGGQDQPGPAVGGLR